MRSSKASRWPEKAEPRSARPGKQWKPPRPLLLPEHGPKTAEPSASRGLRADSETGAASVGQPMSHQELRPFQNRLLASRPEPLRPRNPPTSRGRYRKPRVPRRTRALRVVKPATSTIPDLGALMMLSRDPRSPSRL